MANGVTNLWSPDAREATSTVRKSDQVRLGSFQESFRGGFDGRGQQAHAEACWDSLCQLNNVTVADFSWRSELSLQLELMLVSN